MKSKSILNDFTLVLLYVVLIVSVVFGSYEILESVWLEDAYPDLLYYFHLIRGIGTSFLVVLILWWFFLPSNFLVRGREALTDSSRNDLSHDHPISPQLSTRWFIRLRWIAIVLCALTIYVFGVLTSVIPGSGEVTSLFGLVGILTLLNISYYLWKLKQNNYKVQLNVQIVLDLVCLTLILHYSGGIENPFFLLYLLHVILASIIFRIKRALAFTTLAAVLFSGLGLAEYFEWIPHYSLRFSPRLVTTNLDLNIHRSSIFVFGRIVSFLIVMYGTSIFTTMLMLSIRKSQSRILAETERRKKLLQEFYTAQEEERARVARELHDQIGQALSALQMKVSRLMNQNPQYNNKLDGLKTDVEDTIEDVRSLSSQIRPPAIKEYGLPRALEDYAREASNHYDSNVKLEYMRLDYEDNISYSVDIAIYRVVQEAVFNAITHGEADQVSIILHKQDDRVRLLVEDDGTGFDLGQLYQKTEREYLGIQGMRERIENLGGEFTIETEVGHGTRVKAAIPFTENLVSSDTINN